METLLIKNGTIVTMNSKKEIVKSDILIEDDRIVRISSNIDPQTLNRSVKTIDATNKIVIPGFVQTHIHLTQTLFRGLADDLELMDWLKKKIWPFEAAHTAESNFYTAKLGIGELLKGGTTTIMDMETVNHTNEAFEAIYESGIRAFSGKCMMDYKSDAPDALMETTESSINESVALLKKWHGKDNGRINYAFCPRFVVSCTEELLVKVGQLSKEYGVMIHTHASENRGEIAFVEKDRGMRNIKYLEKIGLTGPNLILAHCIWLDEEEIHILAHSGTHVAHCPTCNMKLASGIAKIPELIAAGVGVSLGADGAPCNNNLDMFTEMKNAALIQKVRLLDPTIMPAHQVFELATMGGAKALGLEHEIGSIEMGKKADLAVLNLETLDNAPLEGSDIISCIVYSASSYNVETTIVNGKVLMQDRKLLTIDEREILLQCDALRKKQFVF